MSKSPENIFNLLARQLAGEATGEEKKLLDEVVQSSESAQRAVSNAHHIWSSDLFSNESSEMVSQKEANEKIWKAAFDLESNKKKMRHGSLLLRAVAALIILVSTTFVLIFIAEDKEDTIPAVTTIQKKTLPGQKSAITLKDGTVVWLNSGSSISYYSDFNEKLRLIHLEGQAYFEVFQDKTKPFIVTCRDLRIEALGTSFDVDGYIDSPIQVSLVTGSVKLSLRKHKKSGENFILNPGEYSVLDINNQFVENGVFDPFEVLAWKEGRLIFDNATIQEIVPKLELWYGVKIINQLSMNLYKPYTSTFEKENLDNILLNMGGVLQFEYEIKGNDVTIKNQVPM
jgi:transmembrane sensor